MLEQPRPEVLAHLCTWDDGSLVARAQPLRRAADACRSRWRAATRRTGWSTCCSRATTGALGQGHGRDRARRLRLPLAAGGRRGQPPAGLSRGQRARRRPAPRRAPGPPSSTASVPTVRRARTQRVQQGHPLPVRDPHRSSRGADDGADTTISSSGVVSPVPTALTAASLRVQYVVKARARSPAGCRASTARSTRASVSVGHLVEVRAAPRADLLDVHADRSGPADGDGHAARPSATPRSAAPRRPAAAACRAARRRRRRCGRSAARRARGPGARRGRAGRPPTPPSSAAGRRPGAGAPAGPGPPRPAGRRAPVGGRRSVPTRPGRTGGAALVRPGRAVRALAAARSISRRPRRRVPSRPRRAARRSAPCRAVARSARGASAPGR